MNKPVIEGVEARRLANAIRALSMDAVEKAKSGHPGMPMGMADAATILFSRFLKFDASTPNWPDRDRFVLSAGHGSMLLYSLLHLTGYADMTLDEIKNFRQLGSKTPGHPEYGHAEGVETTTGPLGQGLANAVGMAMAEAHLAARFGDDLVNHRTWAIAGDGCLMEGISHEAIALAGRQKLNKLIVIWDDNSISIDGAISLADTTDQKARFAASGWNVLACDGHDGDDVARAFDAATKSDKPVLVACRTTIGYGSPKKAGTAHAHGEPLGVDELAVTKKALGWEHGPFEIPDDVRLGWNARERGKRAERRWKRAFSAYEKAHPELAKEFLRRAKGELPSNFSGLIESLIKETSLKAETIASRKASQNVLEVLVPALPELIGGSADLAGSNLTMVKASKAIGGPGAGAGESGGAPRRSWRHSMTSARRYARSSTTSSTRPLATIASRPSSPA